MAAATATFWCIETAPVFTPSSGHSRSPVSADISHQPSLQARTPRVPQARSNWASSSWTPRGIAPSELLIRYVVCSRMGNSARSASRSSWGAVVAVVVAMVLIFLPSFPFRGPLLQEGLDALLLVGRGE